MASFASPASPLPRSPLNMSSEWERQSGVASPARGSRGSVTSPRKFKHPELEVLQVRHRYRRSIMHVYAAGVWLVAAAAAYMALLHRDPLVAHTMGGVRAASTIVVLFCLVSAGLCLYRFLLPSVHYAGLDLTPEQRRLAGLPPLSEAELQALRARRASDTGSFWDTWLLWPTMVAPPASPAPPGRHRGLSFAATAVSPVSSSVASPLAAQWTSSSSAAPWASPAGAAPTSPTGVTSPRPTTPAPASSRVVASPEGPIRTARDLQQALEAEERKKQGPADVSIGQPTVRLQEYRTGYRTKTEETQYGGDMAPGKENISREIQAGRVRNVEGNLDAWAYNLRRWLATHVFQALVNRMDVVDKHLSRVDGAGINGSMSLNDMMRIRDEYDKQLLTQVQQKEERQVWEERIKIEWYLQVPGSKHKDYVVQRIREFASDDWMAAYRWASGGDYKGRPWSPDLPTDSQIVFHAFCTFMDINMPCLYPHAGANGVRVSPCNHRPFTDSYTRTRETMNTGPADACDLCIYQSDAKPAPRFTLLVRATNNDKAWKEYMHVEAGRNNLLVTICLMAYYVDTYMKGYLESTDLDGLLGLLRVLGPRS